jgi:hypothetical protein
MQELQPYVSPRRVSSSYRLHIHTFIIYALWLKHRFPHMRFTTLENEEKG